MRGYSAIAVLGLLSCLCQSSSLQAGIIDHSSSIDIAASPPQNVRQGILEDDSRIVAFIEQQAFSLPAALPVNISLPGTYPIGDEPGFTPDTIAAGTLVDTYFIHFDPVGEPANSDVVFITGSIEFDRQILGIVTRAATLTATHSITGLLDVLYPSGDFQGIELGQPGTYITLSEDRRTVFFGLPVGPHSDNLRIVTAAVPEASSLILLGLGTGMIAVFRICRRGDANAC